MWRHTHATVIVVRVLSIESVVDTLVSAFALPLSVVSNNNPHTCGYRAADVSQRCTQGQPASHTYSNTRYSGNNERRLKPSSMDSLSQLHVVSRRATSYDSKTMPTESLVARSLTY
jgi:hypothetical protein